MSLFLEVASPKFPAALSLLLTGLTLSLLLTALCRRPSLFRNITLPRARRWSYIYSIAPTSDPFNLGPVSLILYPPISLTPHYSLDLSRRYCPKFSSSLLEYSALDYWIAAYYLALPIIGIWIWVAMVTVTTG